MKRRNTPQLLKSAGVCAGAVAVSAVMLTGCTWFGPHHNLPGTVYGPPPDFEDPIFDPSGNEPEDVYGPPLFWDDEDDYDPEEDVPEPVYGPPGGMAFFVEETPEDTVL